jgi:hypothetical protein
MTMTQKTRRGILLSLVLIALMLFGGSVLERVGFSQDAYAAPKKAKGRSKFVAIRGKKKVKKRGQVVEVSKVEQNCDSDDPMWKGVKATSTVEHNLKTGAIKGTSTWVRPNGDKMLVQFNGKMNKEAFVGKLKCQDGTGSYKNVACDGDFKGKRKGAGFSNFAWDLAYQK